MTNRTVEFYENKITETAKATINRNIAIFSTGLPINFEVKADLVFNEGV